MKKLLCLIAFLMVLSACERKPKGDLPLEDFDRTGIEITTVTNVYSSRSDFNRALTDRGFRPDRDVRNNREGFAIWSPNDLLCEIFLIAPDPWPIDDNATMTLGHEMRHCLFGKYHEE